MTDIRAITVCVDFDDLLRLSLPSVLPHVSEMVVVTAPHDTRTRDYTDSLDKVRTFVTDAFYRHGAHFNKGLALEEGFDVIGRHGWLLIIDADIVLPAGMSDYFARVPPRLGRLYTPRRRILDDPKCYPHHADPASWAHLPPRHEDRAHYGYFQLFRADDVVLRRRPWYSTDWTHAGRCDDDFQHRWPKHLKERPDFEVLHLGKCDENWFGRTSAHMDGAPAPEVEVDQRRHLQRQLRQKHGWGYKKLNIVLDEKINKA